MAKKLTKLCLAGLVVVLVPGWLSTPTPQQKDEDILPGNRCVSCHSKLSSPLALSNKYFEWHVSLHRDKAIGCNECHGGDLTTKDKAKAHGSEVLPPSDPAAKVNAANLPTTCSKCHPEVVKAFVESDHYLKLKDTNMGPSCTTCHEHMASAVVQTPNETAAMCARCHNTVGGPLPPKPAIPEKAQDVMEALSRANGMIVWADRLIEVGDEKKMDLTKEKEQLALSKAALREARNSWHGMEFDMTRKKADESFDLGTKAKDKLMAKLYPQPTQ